MSHRSDKKEWTALVAAFLLFAAALLVVSPAEASRTTTDARSNLAPSSSLELPPLAEATLWDYLQRAAFALVNTFDE